MTAGAAEAESVEELHRSAVVVNGLVGSGAVPQSSEAVFDLPAIMRAGGVTAANLTVSVTDGFRATARKLSRLLRAIDARSEEHVHVANSVDDVLSAKAEDGTAIIVGFQNSDPLEGTLEYLDLFHRLGLRVLQLTYQRRNRVGDGCGEPADAGLSLFGRELVAELNRLGVLIDLSHTGTQSTLEAIELSKTPVAFTHANLRALNPLARNKSDEEITLLAAKGGVMGINAIARLISPRGREQGASLDDFLDQIDYVAELVGVDHVGIGLDINEGMTREDFERRRRTFLKDFPELQAGGEFPFEHYYACGLDTMANVRFITRGLVARGYSDEDVLKILGGNFLRVFEQAWRPVE